MRTRTPEQIGAVATAATLTASLYAALVDLVQQIESGEPDIEIDEALALLAVADKALYVCPGSCAGARLPLGDLPTVPPHLDGRGRSCTHVGAYVYRSIREGLKNHALPGATA